MRLIRNKGHKEQEEPIKTSEDIIPNKGIENPLKNYSKYIENLEDHDWIREKVTIYENLSKLAAINNLKANTEGTVIDLVCPPGRIISIMGKENKLSDNNKIEIVPFLEVRFTNTIGEDIDPNTHIKILKKKILRKDIELYDVQYKDISILDYSDSVNKFKSYTNLFRFKDGIALKGEDHLKLYVINPDIDINNVKFNLGVDLWTQM